MSKASLENEIRNRILNQIIETFNEDDPRYISNSEIMIPVVDSENNGKFAIIKVSIPRGTRNGTGGYDEYDGYAAAAEWEREVEEKEAHKKAKEEAKAIADAEKERKRKARTRKIKSESSE